MGTNGKIDDLYQRIETIEQQITNMRQIFDVMSSMIPTYEYDNENYYQQETKERDS